MPQNTELLNKIYKSSKTSVEAIDIAVTGISLPEFDETLLAQKKKYFKIAEEALGELKNFNMLPEEQSFLEKLNFSVMFRVERIKNTTPKHMAEILIDGCTCGINEIVGELHAAKNVSPLCQSLAQILVETEEETIGSLQKFL